MEGKRKQGWGFGAQNEGTKVAVDSKPQSGPQMSYKEASCLLSALTSPPQNDLAQCNVDRCQKPSTHKLPAEGETQRAA